MRVGLIRRKKLNRESISYLYNRELMWWYVCVLMFVSSLFLIVMVLCLRTFGLRLSLVRYRIANIAVAFCFCGIVKIVVC